MALVMALANRHGNCTTPTLVYQNYVVYCVILLGLSARCNKGDVGLSTHTPTHPHPAPVNSIVPAIFDDGHVALVVLLTWYSSHVPHPLNCPVSLSHLPILALVGSPVVFHVITLVPIMGPVVLA